MINGLDLFSGIGGMSIGLRDYVTTVAYCEQDRHAQSILLSRMSEGKLDKAPIWDDITTLRGNMFNVPIDIIFGGFPCQDISVAGHGRGLEGKRSGLFYEVCRLVKEIKPYYAFLENVPAIRTRGLREVIREFTDLGYDCRWTCVSAGEVGAPHIRKRWFLLAYTNSKYLWEQSRWQCREEREVKGKPRDNGTKKSLANTSSFSWETKSRVCRVVNGLPFRVDRIKRLGNAVVPLQAKIAFESLLGKGLIYL